MLEEYVKRIGDRRGHRYSTAHLSLFMVERHFPFQFDCTVCFIMPNKCNKKGKGSCKRKGLGLELKKTTFFCDDCPGKQPLRIIPCFRIYHTVKRYRQLCTSDNSKKNND